MIGLKQRRSRQLRMVGLPLACVLMACGALVLHAIVLRDRTLARYELPEDRSATSMLRFMRELDGAYQPRWSRVLDTSNVRMTCDAMRAAWQQIDRDRQQLSESELREADRYRLQYGLAAYMSGHGTDLPGEVDSLLQVGNRILQDAGTLLRKEESVILNLIYVLEHASRTADLLDLIASVRARLEDLPDDPASSELARRLAGIETRIRLPGSEWDLQSTTLQGEPFRLSDLRGKFVYVEFWGANCKACTAELPALKRIYEAYRPHGFEIVGVCIGSSASRIQNTVESRDLPWIQLCDDPVEGNAALVDHFGILAVPTTFLIDRDGKVLAANLRPLAADDDRNLEKRLRSSDNEASGRRENGPSAPAAPPSVDSVPQSPPAAGGLGGWRRSPYEAAAAGPLR